MIFDFLKSWNKSSKKIRKRIQYKDLVIVLYDYKHQDPIEKESNICAFGLENNFTGS